MKIDLRSVPVGYINLDSYPNRNASMVNMLTREGFSNVTRISGIVRNELPEDQRNHDVIGDAHLKALQTLPDNTPVLIMEDDCVERAFSPVIEVPDDADLIYLGIHGAGLADKFPYEGSGDYRLPNYERVDGNLWRVYSMFAAHAILYVTPFSRQLIENALKLSKTTRMGCDVQMACALPYAKVYAFDTPMWYQYDFPELTDVTLSTASNEMIAHYGGGCPDYPAPLP